MVSVSEDVLVYFLSFGFIFKKFPQSKGEEPPVRQPRAEFERVFPRLDEGTTPLPVFSPSVHEDSWYFPVCWSYHCSVHGPQGHLSRSNRSVIPFHVGIDWSSGPHQGRGLRIPRDKKSAPPVLSFFL